MHPLVIAGAAFSAAILLYWLWKCKSDHTEPFRWGGYGWRGGYGWGRPWGWRGGWRPRGWWRGWWNTPYYYVPEVNTSAIVDNDTCDCFGNYKSSVDAGIAKEKAAKVLAACAEKALRGLC